MVRLRDCLPFERFTETLESAGVAALEEQVVGLLALVFNRASKYDRLGAGDERIVVRRDLDEFADPFVGCIAVETHEDRFANREPPGQLEARRGFRLWTMRGPIAGLG